MATKRPRRSFQQILDNVAAVRRFTAGLDERSFKTNEHDLEIVSLDLDAREFACSQALAQLPPDP